MSIDYVGFKDDFKVLSFPAARNCAEGSLQVLFVRDEPTSCFCPYHADTADNEQELAGL